MRLRGRAGQATFSNTASDTHTGQLRCAKSRGRASATARDSTRSTRSQRLKLTRPDCALAAQCGCAVRAVGLLVEFTGIDYAEVDF